MSYDIYPYTKIQSGFDYIKLPNIIAETELETYCNRLLTNYSSTTKVWSKQFNSIWLARHYLAIKMILASSVMLTSLGEYYGDIIQIREYYGDIEYSVNIPGT